MSLKPTIPPEAKSRFDQAREIVSENQIPVAVGIGLFGYWLYKNGIPGWWITVMWGIVYGAIPAYLIGMYVVKKTFPDTRREVIELNLSDENDQITARSWFIPEDVWRNRSRGDRPEIEPENGAQAIVTELEEMDDIGRISVEGANTELADPVSMVSRDEKVKEIEENLLEQAEEADKLKATVKAKALEIQRENVHSLLAAVEKGTQLDPGAVEKSIEGINVNLDLSPEKFDDQDPERDQTIDRTNGHSEQPSDPLEVNQIDD
jgi:hypothetical protein